MKESTTAVLPQPIDLDAHEADKARRQAVRDARRGEMLKCLDSGYAAQREMEKPVYEWTVKAEWLSTRDSGELVQRESEQVVACQTESDAWALFCDKIGTWPSPRDCKRTIKRGKQVSVSQSISGARDTPIPRETVTPLPKKLRVV